MLFRSAAASCTHVRAHDDIPGRHGHGLSRAFGASFWLGQVQAASVIGEGSTRHDELGLEQVETQSAKGSVQVWHCMLGKGRLAEGH